MKITDVDVMTLDIKMKLPYRSAKKTEVVSQQYLTTNIVTVKSDDGLIGYGEIPSIPRMFETPEVIKELFISRLKGLLINEDPYNFNDIVIKVVRKFKVSEHIIAGLDVALHDLLAKHLNIPLYKLLGGSIKGKVAPASSLIPLLSPEEAAAVAEDYLRNGVKVLKMKAGDDPILDVERVKSIREAVGDKIILNLDVGESWINAKRSLRVIRQLERYGVDYVEQPVLAHDIEGLKEVTRNTEITIVADESVRPEFILRLVYEKAADMLALKPLNGGIASTKKYATIAFEGGIDCNIGTYVAQTGILDAAGIHLFISTPNITVSEVGRSEILLENNPVTGIKIEGGLVNIFDEPGLGVKVTKDLKLYMSRK
ncbi:MAG: mandelate racemase/muconate lactonizing enzyme family protein [Sulfolobales archaeon]|nr:mandelate racemase/muconate lactonizing enzyme family protein [Sulfolobales archaeon]MCX8186112.1 mandelate racemase/muconate lactonizing enzyme family protein [Sulfolobales archaeon]MDW7969407.1 mandelate racemase/muconate lactonizing enzyme family protein [Sulfolobales archaeon]